VFDIEDDYADVSSNTYIEVTRTGDVLCVSVGITDLDMQEDDYIPEEDTP
jgi:hypothetical protein